MNTRLFKRLENPGQKVRFIKQFYFFVFLCGCAIQQNEIKPINKPVTNQVQIVNDEVAVSMTDDYDELVRRTWVGDANKQLQQHKAPIVLKVAGRKSKTIIMMGVSDCNQVTLHAVAQTENVGMFRDLGFTRIGCSGPNGEHAEELLK